MKQPGNTLHKLWQLTWLLLPLAIAACAAPKVASVPAPGAFTLESAAAQCGPAGPIVSLGWSASSAATRYEIERDYVVLGTVDAPVQVFQDAAPVDASASTYVIRARNATGVSSSPAVSVSIPWDVCDPAVGPVIAAGASHGLAVAPDGTVWSWGHNYEGALGNGHDEQQLRPSQVLQLSGIVSVAASSYSSFAIDKDGNVWEWGEGLGQFGAIMSIQGLSVPSRVPGLSSIVSLAVGEDHVLALASDGSVFAWGANYQGQLGIGSTLQPTSPVEVTGLDDAIALAAGGSFSMALHADGTVSAWGSNDVGQLGSFAEFRSTVPVAITGVAGATAIAAGRHHALVLLSDNSVLAWGENEEGQLGADPGLLSDSPVPTPVPGLKATHIAAALYGSMAIQPDGTVATWGQALTPDRQDAAPHVPWTVPGLNGVVGIAPGWSFMMAVDQMGSIYAWGDNRANELGYNLSTVVWDLEPVLLEGEITAVAAREYDTFALLDSGELYSWGANHQGLLGHGTDMFPARSIPTRVESLAGVTAIAQGNGFALAAVGPEGTVWSWGRDSAVHLGRTPIDGNNLLPGKVGDLIDVEAVAAGTNHSLALTDSGELYAWGRNNQGQLGNGDNNDEITPVMIMGGDVIAIAAGNSHSVALLADGTVFTWGLNRDGALGLGSPDVAHIQVGPFQVDIEDVIAISAGEYFTLALHADGTVSGWGANHDAQLNLDYGIAISPVKIAGLSGITAISAGTDHSLALQLGTGVWAWGSSVAGEIPGYGGGETTPVLLAGTANATGIEAGNLSTFVVVPGGLLASGRDETGPLGRGLVNWSSVPLLVEGVVTLAP